MRMYSLVLCTLSTRIKVNCSHTICTICEPFQLFITEHRKGHLRRWPLPWLGPAYAIKIACTDCVIRVPAQTQTVTESRRFSRRGHFAYGGDSLYNTVLFTMDSVNTCYWWCYGRWFFYGVFVWMERLTQAMCRDKPGLHVQLTPLSR